MTQFNYALIINLLRSGAPGLAENAIGELNNLITKNDELAKKVEELGGAKEKKAKKDLN